MPMTPSLFSNTFLKLHPWWSAAKKEAGQARDSQLGVTGSLCKLGKTHLFRGEREGGVKVKHAETTWFSFYCWQGTYINCVFGLLGSVPSY